MASRFSRRVFCGIIPAMKSMRCCSIMSSLAERMMGCRYYHLNHFFQLRASQTIEPLVSKAKRDQPTLELSCGGKKLLVNWSDGEESVFHSLWLRQNCRCPSCWNSSFDQKLIDGYVLQNNPTILSASVSELNGEGVVKIRWSYEGEIPEHDGHFHLNWLKDNSYSAEKLKKALSDSRPLFTDYMATFSYKDVQSNEEEMWKWLCHLSEYGFALLTDVPTVPGQVTKVCENIGLVHSNYYGEYAIPDELCYAKLNHHCNWKIIILYVYQMFDVKVLPGADDIGSSSKSLSYHADIQHLENVPGLQLLHCLRFDECIEGGMTVLYDYYRIACEMREQHRREFDAITRIPFNFHRYYGSGKNRRMMRIRTPLIVLSEQGEIITLRLHPHGEGPLIASEEDVEEFYKAYTCLWNMFNTTKHKFPHRLRPGEALSFNNRRMAHSRTPIKSNGGVRHLQGSYVIIDDFKSRVRVLASKFAPPGYRVKNVFNSDCL